VSVSSLFIKCIVSLGHGNIYFSVPEMGTCPWPFFPVTDGAYCRSLSFFPGLQMPPPHFSNHSSVLTFLNGRELHIMESNVKKLCFLEISA
jgi:hypothetical protein